MITLVIGGSIGLLILRDRLPVRAFAAGIVAVVSFALPLLLATRPWIVSRYLPVTLTNGKLALNPVFFGGLESRFQLTKKALNLWTQQPIFGYGWFASPENPKVGYLDVLYSQLLVDLGAIGFVLALGFYLVVVRAFVTRISSSSLSVPTAGAGWLVGMLAAGIGGAHVRVPRLLFLLVFVLVAASSLYSRDTRRFWS